VITRQIVVLRGSACHPSIGSSVTRSGLSPRRGGRRQAKASHRNELTDTVIPIRDCVRGTRVCEYNLIMELEPSSIVRTRRRAASIVKDEISLNEAFVNILGRKSEDSDSLEAFERREHGPFYDDIEYHSGEAIFQEGATADSYFIVLTGAVALFRKSHRTNSDPNISSLWVAMFPRYLPLLSWGMLRPSFQRKFSGSWIISSISRGYSLPSPPKIRLCRGHVASRRPAAASGWIARVGPPYG